MTISACAQTFWSPKMAEFCYLAESVTFQYCKFIICMELVNSSFLPECALSIFCFIHSYVSLNPRYWNAASSTKLAKFSHFWCTNCLCTGRNCFYDIEGYIKVIAYSTNAEINFVLSTFCKLITNCTVICQYINQARVQ